MAPRLHIIVSSTRPGRLGPSVARWFEGFAREHGGFEPVPVDLAEFGLPVFDEPKHPLARRRYQHEHTKRWSESVAAADAYAVPEYNHFPPPSLANALNHLVAEWTCKPARLVNHGGVSGGLGREAAADDAEDHADLGRRRGAELPALPARRRDVPPRRSGGEKRDHDARRVAALGRRPQTAARGLTCPQRRFPAPLEAAPHPRTRDEE